MTDRTPYLEIAATRAAVNAAGFEAARLTDAERWAITYGSHEGSLKLTLGSCPIDEDPAELLKGIIEEFPAQFYKVQAHWLKGDGEAYTTDCGTPSEVMHDILEYALDVAPADNIDAMHPALYKLRSGLIEADQICEGLRDEPIYLYSVSMPQSAEDSEWMVHAQCEKSALNLYAHAIIEGDIPCYFDGGDGTEVTIRKISAPMQGPRVIAWEEFQGDLHFASEIPVVKHAIAQGYDTEQCDWITPETEAPSF